MRHFSSLFIILIVTLFSGLCFAQNKKDQTGTYVSPAPIYEAESAETVQTMDKIKAQNLLLQEKVKQANLLKKLQEDGSTAATTLTTPNGTSSVTSNANAAVEAILGVNARLRARIRLSGGATVTLTRGDKIPGTAYTISSISKKGVMVRNLHIEDDSAKYLPFVKGAPKHGSNSTSPEQYTGPDSTVGGIQ